MLQRQTLSKKIKLVVVMIFFITTTGFTYSNNVQEVPDYIHENIIKGNINLEDKITIDLKTKISQEEYENTIKDGENFLKENHIIFNNTSREEFSEECDKFIKNKKEHTNMVTPKSWTLYQRHLEIFVSGFFVLFYP